MKRLTVDDLKALIPGTWFDVDEEGDCIVLSSRDNGDVGEERAGYTDVLEGRRILDLIRAAYPSRTRRSAGEVVDEWVQVYVRTEPRSPEEIAEREAASGNS